MDLRTFVRIVYLSITLCNSGSMLNFCPNGLTEGDYGYLALGYEVEIASVV
jgi:hypothetical protein